MGHYFHRKHDCKTSSKLNLDSTFPNLLLRNSSLCWVAGSHIFSKTINKMYNFIENPKSSYYFQKLLMNSVNMIVDFYGTHKLYFMVFFFLVFFSHWKSFKTVLHLEVLLHSHHYRVITPWIFWLLIPPYKENICLTTVKIQTEQLVFSFNYMMRKLQRSYLPIVYCIKKKVSLVPFTIRQCPYMY